MTEQLIHNFLLNMGLHAGRENDLCVHIYNNADTIIDIIVSECRYNNIKDL